MKKIDDFYMPDDFEFEEILVKGVPIFATKTHLNLSKQAMLYSHCEGNVCDKCGGFASKYSSRCPSCYKEDKNKIYKTLPLIENATEMYYSDTLDKYFTKDDVYDDFFEDENDITLDDLRIHPCVKIYPSRINIDNYFEDMGDEFDIDSYTGIDEVRDCEEKINKIFSENFMGYTADMKHRSYPWTEEEFEDIKRENNLS